MNLKNTCAAFLALGLVASRAFADAPDARLITAPLVAPAEFTGSTTRTTGIAAWTQTPPEMLALARSLGSELLAQGAISPDQYAEDVFKYVRSNIAVELRFGLGKGGRGALIDQSGTSFDQAELMLRLLKVPNHPQLVPTIRYGTITLTATQFGSWTGLVYNLNQTTQSFTVDATAACKLLADGGIPAACSPASGALANVTLAHAWVGVNGKLYDPALKQHTLKNAIDLSSAMGCGTDAASTCGSQVTTAMMSRDVVSGTDVLSGTFAGTNYYQNLNVTNARTALQSQYVTLESHVIANNRLAQVTDIVGGKVLAPVAVTPGSTLPYASEFNFWSEIPDAFRTTMAVTVPGCGFTVYADEIAGRRVSLTGGSGGDGGGADHLWIDGVDTPCTPNSLRGQILGITIAVNHP